MNERNPHELYENGNCPECMELNRLSSSELSRHAQNLRDKGFAPNYGPLANVPQLATLMVLVAEDVSKMSITGRTRESILANAQLVIAGIMNGAIVI